MPDGLHIIKGRLGLSTDNVPEVGGLVLSIFVQSSEVSEARSGVGIGCGDGVVDCASSILGGTRNRNGARDLRLVGV